jgi:hypothetical protein
MKNHSREIGRNLITWFWENQRPLPWRRNYSPYAAWGSYGLLMGVSRRQSEKKRIPGSVPSTGVIGRARCASGSYRKAGSHSACLYPVQGMCLHAYRCELDPPGQEIILGAAVEGQWVSLGELDNFAFPSANRRLIHILRDDAGW